MKKKISMLLVLIMIFVPVNASTISDKKTQLESANQHIEDKKSQLAQKSQEKANIQEEIRQVDTQLVTVQDKIAELDTKLEEKKAQIEISQQNLDAANIKKDDQYEATKQRMVQMYKNQKIGYLQVIFSSSSFWEAINRMEYVRRISEKDGNILDEYEAQIQTIETQKAQIEQERSELDLLQKEAVVKSAELEEIRTKKQSAMSRLAAEEGKLQEEIESLKEVSENLKNEIDRLIKAQQQQQSQSSSGGGGGGSKLPTVYEGGTFLWPVPGYYRISSEYVDRISPITGKAEFHTGIDIPAGYGENVVAAGDGVVIKSGWVNGYGNTVMISHGSGLVTLYGHNSSLVASAGQRVKQGQTIAKIGSTGYSTGNHCHFEVRLNGNHTDPMPYLQG